MEPQKCWKYGQKAVQSHGTCTLYRVWPGRGVPNLSRAGPAGKSSLETRQKEKRDPSDADDAGQGGQHHQHHWGSWDPKNASKIPPCRGDSLLEREWVLERRRSDDARASGVGAGGATAYRTKALEWTGSALDHGGVAGFKAAAAAADPGTRAGAASSVHRWS